MSTQDKTTPKIGFKLTGSEAKDAIHFAVACVKAANDVVPGEHVKYNKETNTISSCGLITVEAIGIVDPFLKETVKKDEYCWLFLYPQTITNLRHQWEHPAFDNNQYNYVGTQTFRYSSKFDDRAKQESYEIIKKFAEQNGTDAEDLIQKLVTDNYYCFGQTDYDDSDESKEILWRNIEIYKGEKYSEEYKKATYFRCAC